MNWSKFASAMKSCYSRSLMMPWPPRWWIPDEPISSIVLIVKYCLDTFVL
jgi:hypothetical protein